MTTWRDLLVAVEGRLAEAGVEGPGVEARWLVEEASGFEGADHHDGLAREPLPRQAANLEQMVVRRLGGEPLQYVLGHWAFRRLDLMVDRRVLIPRPETEVVAGIAIEAATRRADAPRCLDLGTGSGAIALSLAVEIPAAEVWGTDVSADALVVARANQVALGRAGARVRLLEGSWFEPVDPSLAGTFDVIVSNPPYVADAEPLPPEVGQHEPVRALRAGPTGLECVEAILDEAPRWLASGGALVVEIAPHQSDAVAALATEAGFADVELRPDLAGRDRALVGTRR